jgi:hypothetical protein
MLRFGAAERQVRRAVSPRGALARMRQAYGLRPASQVRSGGRGRWTRAVGRPQGRRTRRQSDPETGFVSARSGRRARRSAALRNYHPDTVRRSGFGPDGGRRSGGRDREADVETGPLVRKRASACGRTRGEVSASLMGSGPPAAACGTCFGTGGGLARRVEVVGAGKRTPTGVRVALRCGRRTVGWRLVT